MSTNEVINLIKEFCEERDNEFRNDYSGRSMYGGHCIGIVTSNQTLAEIVALCDYLRDNGVESCEEVFESIREDDMGHRNIIYFPYLQEEWK